MCTTNDLVPSSTYSNPFTVEVKELDCSKFITVGSISTPTTLYLLETASATKTTIITGSTYATTSQPSDCPLSFALKSTSNDNNYPGSDI